MIFHLSVLDFKRRLRAFFASVPRRLILAGPARPIPAKEAAAGLPAGSFSGRIDGRSFPSDGFVGFSAYIGFKLHRQAVRRSG